MSSLMLKEKTNIVQSNFLIENRPKLTLDETRLFLTIVGSINKDDDSLKPLEIPVSDFTDIWGIDPNGAYHRLKAAMRGLVRKEFFIEGINPKTGKMRFLTTSYISAASYEEGEGYAVVQVSEAFKPYLLELKENYTRYVLKNVLNLTTVNAIRNYELLKQYQTLGSRTIEVADYRDMLKLENKYALNADLRRFVIEPALEEINLNTDIRVAYEFIGRGKRAKIRFSIKKAEVFDYDPDQITFEDCNSEKGKDLEVEDFRSAVTNGDLLSDEELAEIVLTARQSNWALNLPFHMVKEDRDLEIFRYIHAQDIYTNARKPKNKKAYLLRAIRENYAQVL